MKKITAVINGKTGGVSIKTEGYSGDECYKATEALEKSLGMDRACAVPTGEFYQEKQENTQQIVGE